MEKKVLSFIQKHELLHKGAKVLIGVSGGPDSIALLSFLRSIQEKWNIEIIVLSVEHGLRGADSLADYAYVERVAEEWGFSFYGTAVNVEAYANQHRVSIEVAAREVRYQFFKEQMEAHQADYLALGHHGDDQIETLLMKLVRSASSTAFTGIPVQRTFACGKIIRPLLTVSRTEIEQYCSTHQLHPRIDQTNLETAHTRNYYRNLVVPLLKEKNTHLHRTVQFLSETLQEDERYLQKQAKEMFNHVTTIAKNEKKVSLDIKLFLNYDYPLQRRVYKLILNYLYGKILPDHLSYIHEEQFFLLIKEQSGNVQIDFPEKLKLSRSYDELSFYFANQDKLSTPLEQVISVPGLTHLTNGAVIQASYSPHRVEHTDSYTFYLNVNDVSLPLLVRTRRPGDRMSWKGLNGTKKLKDIFIDMKVPQHKRNQWPIIVDQEGKIIWLIGLKKAKMSSNNTSQWICVQYKK